MNQKELFTRDEYAALADDCDAIGRKEVAYLLKSQEPNFDPDDFDPKDGASWVSSCLSPKRRHEFNLYEISLIVNEARKYGSHAYVTYLLEKTYYEPTKPKTYDVEVLKVGNEMEKIQAAAKSCSEYLQNINRELKK